MHFIADRRGLAAAFLPALVFALVAWSAEPALSQTCVEPQIRIAQLQGRDAHNSVSQCLIEIDPEAPYTAAILAQELWEWHFKRQTGRSIGLGEEIRSHEREVQAAAALFPSVSAWDYRAKEAWEMLRGSYGFARSGWRHRQIFEAMRAEEERAKADVRRMMPALLELRRQLGAYRSRR